MLPNTPRNSVIDQSELERNTTRFPALVNSGKRIATYERGKLCRASEHEKIFPHWQA